MALLVNAQEEEGLSDLDFEDSDEDMEGGESSGNAPPNKKRKA
jgi:hypothetical protein